MSKCPIPFLAEYKNLFGIPGEGIHKIRFFGLGAVDILATIILAYIFKIIYKKKFIYCFIFSIILGEIIHYAFCVNTKGLEIIKKFAN